MRRPGPQATVSLGSLAAAVAYTSRSLPRSRHADPALAGIRVEAGDGHVTVTACGRELTARSSISGADLAPGAVRVDGRHLAAAVKTLPGRSGSAAMLRPEAGGLAITCCGAEVAIPPSPSSRVRLPDREMPPLTGTTDGVAFARSVARVATAASTDKRYPALGFLLLEMGEENIALSAMDRFRIAADSVPWAPAGLPPGGQGILVPAAGLARFAAGCRDKVTIHAPAPAHDPDRHAGFSDGSRDLISAAVGEDSPLPGALQRNHIADGPAAVVTGSARALLDAVRRAGRLCGPREPVHLGLTPGSVQVGPVRDGAVRGNEAVPASATGPVTSAWFNPRLLADALHGIAGEARLTITQAHGPALIAPADGDDPFRTLLMPKKGPKPGIP
jgi:DNA polymerase-3 subunit beta